MFKTYDACNGRGPPWAYSNNASITTAVLASMAAAPYFPPKVTLKLNDKPHFFRDGGFLTNNPTELAAEEVLAHAPIGMILSVGTGKTELGEDGTAGAFLNLIGHNAEHIHEHLRTEVEKAFGGLPHASDTVYCRVNPNLTALPFSFYLNEDDPAVIQTVAYFVQNQLQTQRVVCHSSDSISSSALGDAGPLWDTSTVVHRALNRGRTGFA